ncbi:hypothetical protein HOLleu_22142 [Holothuria leucospilota]|uniref:Uncharacterized protein n=1 Tax=Holothuria leucospilota TaxID=206669 RepID=A0A9Q1H7A3_HOLLE|nr:hypothetical protein HOLleu_22142 [Holothuria leucospilota]
MFIVMMSLNASSPQSFVLETLLLSTFNVLKSNKSTVLLFKLIFFNFIDSNRLARRKIIPSVYLMNGLIQRNHHTSWYNKFLLFHCHMIIYGTTNSIHYVTSTHKKKYG